MGTRVTKTDDLTGKDAEVVKQYTVTLTPKDDKDKLSEATAEFDLTPESATAVWRWITETDARDLATALKGSPRRIAGSDSGDATEAEVIRAWAKSRSEFNGVIKDKGAIPATIVAAYRTAHPATPATESNPSESNPPA